MGKNSQTKSDFGINILFENIGKKIIMPDYDYNNSDNSAQKNYSKKRQQEIKDKKIKLEKRNSLNSLNIKKKNKIKCCY